MVRTLNRRRAILKRHRKKVVVAVIITVIVVGSAAMGTVWVVWQSQIIPNTVVLTSPFLPMLLGDIGRGV